MRAFEYDGFISHNALDAAKHLLAALEQGGTHVYCDEANDLSDRQVEGHIARALARSMCVVVHVPSGFRDTEWCRAEYQRALYKSRESGITRVVVARGAPFSPIPTSLAGAPIFNIYEQTDLLSDYLKDANRIPDALADEIARQEQGAYGPRLGTHRNLEFNTDRMRQALLYIRDRIEKTIKMFQKIK